MTPPLFFSVVISGAGPRDRWPLALKSVLEQSLPPSLFDVWIARDAPLPENLRAAPRVRFTEAGEDVAEKTGAEWIVFLDGNAVAAPDWLEAYRQAIETAGDVAVFFGGRTDPVFEEKRPVWLHDGLLPFLSVLQKERPFQDGPFGFALPGAHVAARREAWLECGGFNRPFECARPETSELTPGREVVLAARLKARGKAFHYVPNARAEMFVPSRRLTRSWLRRRAAWQTIAELDGFEPTLAEKNAMWSELLSYLKQIPPDQVPFMGLFWDTDDPELFRRQVKCAQYAAHFLFAQGCYPKDAAA